MLRAIVLLLLFGLTFVSCGEKSATMDDLQVREVRLPSGQRIQAELAIDPVMQQRGLMFRDSLAPDRGMLFVHRDAGQHTYWMYQVRIPLDLIWMDIDHRVVELALDTPPCRSTSARECPVYGGKSTSNYVLELGGGLAQKYGIRVGDRLDF